MRRDADPSRPGATAPRRRAVLRFARLRAISLRGLLPAVLLAAAGCDPPPADEVLLGAPPPEPFALEATNVRDSALPQGTDLVLTFNRPLDARTAGPRTVVVTTPRRRRVTAAVATVAGRELRLPADALAELASDGDLDLRVEGGASPCALRDDAGEPLAGRVDLRFRVGAPGPTDLDGPSLVSSRPADGAGDVRPGTAVELRFDEPVVAAGESCTVRVDGAEVRATVRAAADRRRVFVRPDAPFAPGARVSVEVHRCIADDAGNPLAAGSRRRVTFHVREGSRPQVEEDFTSEELEDVSATTCAWGEPDAAGFLVPRSGPLPLPALDVEPSADLGDRDEIRFQILVRADDVDGGTATSLRLRFTQSASGSPVRSVRIEGGPADAESLLPTFADNRAIADLATLAESEPDAAAPGPGATTEVDVPFERPLALERGRAVLFDVTVAVAPGARLGAAPDADARSLVRAGGRERLIPAVALMVAGAPPAARSLWYDAGVESPRWLGASLVTESGPPGAVRVEFQSAPRGRDGRPDASLAGDWTSDLALVPPRRFVRFRVRWTERDAESPRVDRVVMPFDPASR